MYSSVQSRSGQAASERQIEALPRAHALWAGLLERGDFFLVPSQARAPLSRFMAAVGRDGPTAGVALLEAALVNARELEERGLLPLPSGFSVWSEPDAAAELEQLGEDFGTEFADAIRTGKLALKLEHVWTLRRLHEPRAFGLLSRAMLGEDMANAIEQAGEEGLPRPRRVQSRPQSTSAHTLTAKGALNVRRSGCRPALEVPRTGVHAQPIKSLL